MYEMSSKAINKTLLVFGNVFAVNAHRIQTDKVDLHVVTITNNLLKFQHHAGLKIEEMNCENSPHNVQFCTQYSLRIRTKPYRLRRIPTSLHIRILARPIL